MSRDIRHGIGRWPEAEPWGDDRGDGGQSDEVKKSLKAFHCIRGVEVGLVPVEACNLADHCFSRHRQGLAFQQSAEKPAAELIAGSRPARI